MSLTDELAELQRMHDTGALSDGEFARAKETLIRRWAASSPSPEETAAQKERQTRQWAMMLHLSVLAGFVVPLAGLVVPIVIWQVKKEDLPGLDAHGRIVLNWIISFLIYAAVAALLIIVIIGIPLLIALCILTIVFPIVGGIKASNGEVWRYPLSIKFISSNATA